MDDRDLAELRHVVPGGGQLGGRAEVLLVEHLAQLGEVVRHGVGTVQLPLVRMLVRVDVQPVQKVVVVA
eukprot:CAMPEP_0206251212 /NCGR_PEP_ID=MMETSP0047_2-20121206/21902_1 /ASSEMBLY_ACC=CAM_ASM_000192 /TAXON_ID=195065 /ORGANISM="Chroomonas mesostigmatica_cf, Strain CCMP1168" /LENGTH=68 /DNA_ID=CAMNT_0053677147 /DNA_START=323 /DNA_END=526 /DNA_ORIENTATION=+